MTGQLFEIAFGKGVDEGSDPKGLPPGTLLVSENTRIDLMGRTAHRWGTKGYAKTLGGGSVTAGKRLVTRGSDMALVDGQTIETYAKEITAWQAIDRPPNVQVQQRPLIDTQKGANAVDIAVSGDLLVTVFQLGSTTGATIYIKIEELSTRAKVLPPTLVTTDGYRPRVLIRSGNAVVLWTTATGTLSIQEVSLSTFALGTNGAIASGLAASSLFDAFAVGDTLYAGYLLDTGTNRVTLTSFNGASGYAVLHTLSFGLAPTLEGMCVHVSGANLYCAYTTSTSVMAVSLVASSFATVGILSTISSSEGFNVWIVGLGGGSECLIGYNQVSSNGQYSFTTGVYSNTFGLTANTKRVTWGLWILSKPWSFGLRWYAALITWTPTFNFATPIGTPSAVVVEVRLDAYATSVATHRHAATLLNQTSWTPLGVAQAPVDGAGNVYVPAPTADRLPVGVISDNMPLAWYAMTLSADGGDQYRPGLVGPNAFLAGGVPAYFTGGTVFPAGFAEQPIVYRTTIGAGASGNMAAGDYYYVIVYEWRDANGILHRSIPSPPTLAASVVATGSVTLKITTASLSCKQSEATGYGANSLSPVLIAIYRTTVGGTGPYFRLTLEPTYNVVTNDPTIDVISFTDTNADADVSHGMAGASVPLDAQAELYTADELDDEPPGPFLTSMINAGRTVGLAPDRRTVFLSKNIIDDLTVAPGFNEVLTLTFDVDKSALGALDANHVVLGPDSIHVVYGDGPDANGNENTWQVQRIQTDLGCSNPRSVVAIPSALLFQSPRGIEALSRKLEVSWIGKRIQASLAAFPVITSAVLVAAEHEVRFTCVSADGTQGKVLVYDYVHDAWQTRTYTDVSDTTAALIPFADAAMIGGVYTLLTYGGQVYQEDTTTHLEAGSAFVDTDVQTGWLSPSGKLAWHRFKRLQTLGTSVTDHDLEVSIARDYAASWEQVKVFPATTEGVAVGPLAKANVTLMNQKGEAYRVRLRALTPSSGVLGDGAAAIWEGLGIEVKPKPGLPKTAAVEQE